MTKWISASTETMSLFLESIPTLGGVYVILLKNRKSNFFLAYIGSTNNLKKRVMCHKVNNVARYSITYCTVWGKFDAVKIKCKPLDNKKEWAQLEKQLIKRMNPKFNIAHNA